MEEENEEQPIEGSMKVSMRINEAETLRLVFESIRECLIITDLNGVLIDANQGTLKTYGVNFKDDIIGLSIIDLIARPERKKVVTSLEKTLAQESAKEDEYTFLKTDGSEFPGELSISLLENHSGSPVGFVIIVRDITERKKMEEQHIINDRLSYIGEVSTGIAHELNNPLTSIIGFSELLLESENGVPDGIKEDLKLINSKANHGAEVVKNLLTFAQKHETRKRAVNINRIIKKALELRTYEQKINNIQVNTYLTPSLPKVMANSFQLHQVFTNIVINAEHFMIETHGRGTLTITTERTGQMIRASFADDGPGIDKEDLKQIFNPFFTTKEMGKGTGLGLSISYGMISEHGGRIYAESEPGKGANLIVELPVATVNPKE